MAIPSRLRCCLAPVGAFLLLGAPAAGWAQTEGPGIFAVIRAEPTSGAAPLKVRFDASGSTVNPLCTPGIPPNQVQYAWAFGDGGTGSGMTVEHTYLRPGTYTATLVASYRDCRGAAQVAITVSGEVEGGGGGGSGGTLVARVSTDRGCLEEGHNVVYAPGDPITIQLRVTGADQALAQLENILPDGRALLLLRQVVPGNVTLRLPTGRVGSLLGRHALRLRAWAGERAAEHLCSFRVAAAADGGRDGCSCSDDARKQEDPPSVKLAPFVLENWENLRQRIRDEVDRLKGEGKVKEAEALEKQMPPQTPEAYEAALRKALQDGEDFGFTIVGGGAMALADGPAVFGNAAAFAIQAEFGPFKLRDVFTAEKDGKTPLITKPVNGSIEFTLQCSHADCRFVGAAATFIGLKGVSAITNFSERGASDEEFGALKEGLRKLPLPKQFPVLGQIREAVLDLVDLSADVETRAYGRISVHSNEFDIEDAISLEARARLIKNADAQVMEKRTAVGVKESRDGKKTENADVEYAGGSSTTSPSRITFKAEVEARAKALGIGAAHSQMNSACGVVYLFYCADTEGRGEPCDGSDYRVIGDDVLARQIDAAMKRVRERMKKIEPPRTLPEAEKTKKELQKLLKEELDPLFK